jgi:hypothetical protein
VMICRRPWRDRGSSRASRAACERKITSLPALASQEMIVPCKRTPER